MTAMETINQVAILVVAVAIIWALPLALAIWTLAALPIPPKERRARRRTAILVTLGLAAVMSIVYPVFPAGMGLGMLLWTGYWLVRLPIALVQGFKTKRRDRKYLAQLDKEISGGV